MQTRRSATQSALVDGDGQVQLRTSVPTEPAAIRDALKPFLRQLRRVGHEAGALSPWLQPQLLALGLPVVCLEALHVRSALHAQRNKAGTRARTSRARRATACACCSRTGAISNASSLIWRTPYGIR